MVFKNARGVQREGTRSVLLEEKACQPWLKRWVAFSHVCVLWGCGEVMVQRGISVRRACWRSWVLRPLAEATAAKWHLPGCRVTSRRPQSTGAEKQEWWMILFYSVTRSAYPGPGGKWKAAVGCGSITLWGGPVSIEFRAHCGLWDTMGCAGRWGTSS